LHEILQKLRSNAPEWYEKYVHAFEDEYRKQVATLLNCSTDQLARQQGVCAQYAHHLRILKAAQ
jgi:hypothetical protein